MDGLSEMTSDRAPGRGYGPVDSAADRGRSRLRAPAPLRRDRAIVRSAAVSSSSSFRRATGDLQVGERLDRPPQRRDVGARTSAMKRSAADGSRQRVLDLRGRLPRLEARGDREDVAHAARHEGHQPRQPLALGAQLEEGARRARRRRPRAGRPGPTPGARPTAPRRPRPRRRRCARPGRARARASRARAAGAAGGRRRGRSAPAPPRPRGRCRALGLADPQRGSSTA